MIEGIKTRRTRIFRLRQLGPVPVLLVAALAILCLNTIGQTLYGAPANDGGSDALGGYEYPWYDAETRSVKPMKQLPGQKSTTQERDNIPVAKPKSNNTNTTTNTGNGGGTGTGGGAGAGEGIGTVFYIIIAAIILAVIVALVMTFLYIESSKSESTQTSGRSRKQSIEQLPFDLDSAEGDFRSAADAAYRNGDLRKAIIYLYSHVLVTLDQNRLIRLRKGKTNRQYLREVQRHRGLSGYFQQVMLPFESVFFGDHEMDADQFQQCWSGLNEFHSQVKDNAEVLIG